MRMLSFSIAFAMMLPVYAQQNPDSLNVVPFTYQGNTYEVVKNLHAWTTAAAVAKARGGHLIHINSQGEQDSAYLAITVLAGIASNYTTVMDGGGIAYVWIGATDKVTEGTWVWDGDDDGQGTGFWTGQGSAGQGGGSAQGGAFVNWGGKSTGTIKEPDDYGSSQDVAAIALAGWPSGTTLLGVGGEWNDININNALFYIIEYENNTGFGENQVPPAIRVFPNPASDLLSVKVSEDFLDCRIQLVNNLGQLMMESLLHQTNSTLDLGSLIPGLYFLNASKDERNISLKIVKH